VWSEALLVGDSLGTVIMGRKDDFSVTIEEIIHHTQAVVRSVERAMVIADMPFMPYQLSVEESKRNAARLIKKQGPTQSS
jgi:3-methyl-2-oxobutanoate hydroxymethyltransferase